MTSRLLIVTILLLLGSAGIATMARTDPVETAEPLAHFAMDFEEWTGAAAPPFDPAVLAKAGVDEHLNRIYRDGELNPVYLYVGYYHNQRTGDTVHSPLNCLPGNGWQPVSMGRLAVETNASGSESKTLEINRYVIQKGLDRQVVLFWYQSRDRVVASEYWNKIFLVLDAIRTGRTDGALVRVIAPIEPSRERGEAVAQAKALKFVESVLPRLQRYFPA